VSRTLQLALLALLAVLGSGCQRLVPIGTVEQRVLVARREIRTRDVIATRPGVRGAPVPRHRGRLRLQAVTRETCATRLEHAVRTDRVEKLGDPRGAQRRLLCLLLPAGVLLGAVGAPLLYYGLKKRDSGETGGASPGGMIGGGATLIGLGAAGIATCPAVMLAGRRGPPPERLGRRSEGPITVRVVGRGAEPCGERPLPGAELTVESPERAAPSSAPATGAPASRPAAPSSRPAPALILTSDADGHAELDLLELMLHARLEQPPARLRVRVAGVRSSVDLAPTIAAGGALLRTWRLTLAAKFQRTVELPLGGERDPLVGRLALSCPSALRVELRLEGEGVRPAEVSAATGAPGELLADGKPLTLGCQAGEELMLQLRPDATAARARISITAGPPRRRR